MVAALVHRGPDQQGIFSSDWFSFGAARLKIIDLEAGDQPILENGGECGIVFNGEIYNHLELRAELEKLGHKFTSHSDTETVLKAFLQWDTGSFARLRGMFAFAVWNVAEKRVVLARDRMGIKPLYFSQRGEDLYFGSELKASVYPSRNRAEVEPRRTRLLSGAELHPVPVDADRRDSEGPAGDVDGVERRSDCHRQLLETPLWKDSRHFAGRCQGGIERAAGAIPFEST